MTVAARHLDTLRAIVGPGNYLDRAPDLAAFVVDHRRLYHGATPLLLKPGDTAQVAAILAYCNQHGIGVVPIGGNTGYCGGATPSADGTQIMVSLSRMRRIRTVDAANFTLIADAGCVLAEVQRAAAAVDRLFPLSLGSEGSCQIGGNISTNAGGTAVLRYGMMRDLVLGLEVVLPSGETLDLLRPLRKDNTGYDLRNLFIGAEGTLGIITGATLKLFAHPSELVTAFIAVPDPQCAVRLLDQLRSATGDAVSTFELVPRIALELVTQHIEHATDPFDEAHPWYVLAEVTSGWRSPAFREFVEQQLTAAMEQGTVLNAALATSEAQREMFWRLRESIPEAQRRDGASIKHDVSVPTSKLPQFVREASDLVERLLPQGRIVAYGHLGDGNLHFNINQRHDIDAATFLARGAQVNTAVHDLVAAYGGSFSAEHGIGRLKRDELVKYKDPVALQTMRTLKAALDPRGIMNPGKVL